MICDQCGADYHRPITVSQDGKEHHFDCFQCAIATMAPRCGHCDAAVIGQGVGLEGEVYCCEHCALQGSASAGATTEESEVPASETPM